MTKLIYTAELVGVLLLGLGTGHLAGYMRASDKAYKAALSLEKEYSSCQSAVKFQLGDEGVSLRTFTNENKELRHVSQRFDGVNLYWQIEETGRWGIDPSSGYFPWLEDKEEED